MKDKKMLRVLTFSALTAAVMLLLGGCGGVGPEARAYPLTVLIDAVPEGYQVIYDMADLAEMTGQSKDSGTGENEGSTGIVYTAESLEEIRNLYDRGSQYELDIGHVKASGTGNRSGFRGRKAGAGDGLAGERHQSRQKCAGVSGGAAVSHHGTESRAWRFCGSLSERDL